MVISINLEYFCVLGMGVPRMHRPMDPSEMPNLPPPGFSTDGSQQSAAATSQLHVATGQVSSSDEKHFTLTGTH
jgi:hypothetical protein